MNNSETLCVVGVDKVMNDLGVSKPKAYKIIQDLNKQLKAEHPNAIVIAGRVNRNWYYDALLQEGVTHGEQ